MATSLQISVKFDVEKLARDLKVEAERIPVATQYAINNVLKTSAEAVKAEMRRVFDRPTPWTLNSYRVLVWASIGRQGKYGLHGIVGFKDTGSMTSTGDFRNPGFYLQPQMEGGPRRAKRLEMLLRDRTLITAGEFLVPSRFVPLDQYGNVSRGVVQKILANLQSTLDVYSRTPRGGARGGRKKAEYFFGGGFRAHHLKRAIYWRVGGTVVPVFNVVSGAPKYKKRFDQSAVVQREVDRRFPSEFERAFAQLYATAR